MKQSNKKLISYILYSIIFQNLLLKSLLLPQRFIQGNIIMLLNSQRSLSFILRKVLLPFIPKLKIPSGLNGRRLVTKMALIGFSLSFGYVYAIEDESIRSLRNSMQKQINSLKSEYGQTTVYPQIKYNLRGETYEVIFEIDQRKCDLFSLISGFLSVFQSDKTFRITDVKAFTSTTNLTTFYVEFQENDPKFKTPQKGRLTLTGVNVADRPSYRLLFNKDGLITEKDTKALAGLYRQAVKPKKNIPAVSDIAVGIPNKGGQPKKKKGNETLAKLEQLGLTVFDPNDKTVNLDWDCLAGYERQKRQIEDTILLALRYPQIYDEITLGTRVKYEPSRPKAVLFEGPPGTGKTTSAKIIAQQVQVPLIYLPIQAVLSKFYGQSEGRLAQVWQQCEQLGKVIIFIDQIDALAGSRDSDMHEASRRILSTLLRKIDSFESTSNVLLICATNRKADLDPAMLSRIDLSVQFSLPDRPARAAIFRRYAKHLPDGELEKLAGATEGFSGRNISDICKNAERRWASKLIRRETIQKLPDLQEYLLSLEERRSNQLS